MSKKKSAFVLMPFGEPLNSYYPAIFKPALETAGFQVHRADDLFTPRPVMLDIQESILKADVVLCEMTGRNPNVFYELGLAHAVGKPAILVSNTKEDIPFDLRHVRVILYDTAFPGWENKLLSEITKAAKSLQFSGQIWPPELLSRNSNFNIGRSIPHENRTSQTNGSDDRIVQRPLNLGFDGPHDGRLPTGWFNGYGHVDRVSESYITRVIPRPDREQGSCLFIFNLDTEKGEFGTVMQRCASSYLAGQAVCLEGELRTEAVEEWAGLWLRADGATKPSLFFDNMSNRAIRWTTNWKIYRIEAQLPKDTEWLNYGVVLSGPGRVWVDNLKLIVWDKSGVWRDA